MMKRIASLLIIIIAAFSFCSIEASAQKFQVRVVGVSDGDTFTGLNRDNLQLRFRINGIDAPEKKQAFGQKLRKMQKRGVLAYGMTQILKLLGYSGNRNKQ